MRLPKEIWYIPDPYRRLAWAVLLYARYDVLRETEHRRGARLFLQSSEARDWLALLGVSRRRFLSDACNLEV
jgi:hypothetical protein